MLINSNQSESNIKPHLATCSLSTLMTQYGSLVPELKQKESVDIKKRGDVGVNE